MQSDIYYCRTDKLSSHIVYFFHKALPNPRSRVKSLTAVSGGGDGQHDAPEEAGAEEAEAAAGKVVVAAAGAGETVAAAAAAADGCEDWTLRAPISSVTPLEI